MYHVKQSDEDYKSIDHLRRRAAQLRHCQTRALFWHSSFFVFGEKCKTSIESPLSYYIHKCAHSVDKNPQKDFLPLLCRNFFGAHFGNQRSVSNPNAALALRTAYPVHSISVSQLDIPMQRELSAEYRCGFLERAKMS